jgi:hypothetical protein
MTLVEPNVQITSYPRAGYANSEAQQIKLDTFEK